MPILVWHEVASGAPWDIAVQMPAIDSSFATGDYGRYSVQIRNPLSGDSLAWLQEQLTNAGVVLTDAVRQVGDWLHVYFRRNPGPLVIMGVLAAAALVIGLAIIFVKVLRGEPIELPEIIPGVSTGLLLAVSLGLGALAFTRSR